MVKSAGLIVIISVVAGIICAQMIQTDPGAVTSLRNVNPDPNGEPWLVGSMKVTPEVLEKIESIPEWSGPKSLLKASASVSLPDHVYNHQNPEFPQSFSQIGGCCSAASGIGYCYTYESNLIKGTAATSADNQCAYGFIFDFLNNGSPDQGCWYYDAWDITKKTGCISKTDFGGVLEDGSKGLGGTKWGNGYLQYHNAFASCRDSSYYVIKVGTSDGLAKLKRWMYDHGRGDKKGGVAVFSWFATHTFSKIPSGMPDAGKKIITSVSGKEVTEHAMTFAGYDDRIGSSGSEPGALLLQNSWGNSYGDQGRCWVPYKYLSSSDGIWNKQVYVIEVKKHTVKLDYKVTITHDQRSKIQIKIGYAKSATATSADTSRLIWGGAGKSLGAFNYSGGAYPMEGKGGSSTIEIGLDATDLYDLMTGNQGTFFLVVTSKGGTGCVDSFSLMDYSNGTAVKEVPCPKKNVAITSGGTTMLSIPYSKPVVALKDMQEKSTVAHKIKVVNGSVFVPFEGTSAIAMRDMQGRTIVSFQAEVPGWYCLRNKVPVGKYIVTVRNTTTETIVVTLR
jgi:hypothetical protein